MKFKFIISKWANFYFFIQNLSEWHFSCRKEYNILWRKELDKFSLKDENAIKRFKEIHLKYSFEKSYLGRWFFLEENPWIVLKQKLPQKDLINLENIFSLLEKKFTFLWKKELNLLTEWKKVLKQQLKNEKITEQINEDLANLYRAKPLKKNINVYLLVSAANYTGGGSNIDGKSISLEISRCSTKKVNEALGIIWHELIHLHFEEIYFRNLLKKKNFIKNSKKILEATASSLFPLGVLGKKYFGLQTKRTLHSLMLSLIHTTGLIKISSIYLKTQKFFDEEFIKQVLKIIK